MSKHFSYKVTWNQGNSAQLTNSRKVAASVAKKNNGTIFEHNATAASIDHRDEFGVWVVWQKPEPKPEFNVVDFILGFETGTIEGPEIIAGFQHLIDTGLAWGLQGRYGRAAQNLINLGECHAAK